MSLSCRYLELNCLLMLTWPAVKLRPPTQPGQWLVAGGWSRSWLWLPELNMIYAGVQDINYVVGGAWVDSDLTPLIMVTRLSCPARKGGREGVREGVLLIY